MDVPDTSVKHEEKCETECLSEGKPDTILNQESSACGGGAVTKEAHAGSGKNDAAEETETIVTTSKASENNVIAEGSKKNVIAEGSKKNVIAEGSEKNVTAEGSEKNVTAEGSEKNVTAEGSEKNVTAEGSEKNVTAEGSEKNVTLEEAANDVTSKEAVNNASSEKAGNNVTLEEAQKNVTSEENKKDLIPKDSDNNVVLQEVTGKQGDTAEATAMQQDEVSRTEESDCSSVIGRADEKQQELESVNKLQEKPGQEQAEEVLTSEASTNKTNDSSPLSAVSETPTIVPGDSDDAAGAKSPSSAFTEGGLSCSEPDLEPGDSDFIHNVKWINFLDKKLPIITQNANGPCPLIAIVNVLLLSRRLYLPSNINEVTAQQLMDQIGNAILENRPNNMSEEIQHDYEQNMQDAMSILPRLQTGLDVNVKFTGIREFEYTPECIIFDLLNIGLYHGWLVDPQSPDVMAAIGNCGYNQLVEKIITNKTSPRHELVTEALTAEDFLERTGWQLTYHGLCELVTTLKEGELAVLFRNNHFSTLYKKKDRLYQLVTDTGFLNELNMVWETLSSIDGDSQIVDHDFAVVPPKRDTRTEHVVAEPEPPQQQIQNDFMIALSLQEESDRAAKTDRAWEEYKEKELGDTGQLSDEELARRLQEEEQRLLEMHEQQRSQQGSVDGSRSQTSSSSSSSPTGRPRATTPKKKDNCCIL